MLFERSEFIRLSETIFIFSKSFSVLILWCFLIKKKAHLNNLLLEYASGAFPAIKREFFSGVYPDVNLG